MIIVATFIARFENDVKKYGIQTMGVKNKKKNVFENDVKKYGIQTFVS